EEGNAVLDRPALAGLCRTDDLGAVLLHSGRVERSLATEALDHDTGVPIKKNAHTRTGSFASRTASFAASSIVSRDSRGALARSLRPASASVPESRITSGTRGGCVAITARMPFATSSPRVIPPQML